MNIGAPGLRNLPTTRFNRKADRSLELSLLSSSHGHSPNLWCWSRCCRSRGSPPPQEWFQDRRQSCIRTMGKRWIPSKDGSTRSHCRPWSKVSALLHISARGQGAYLTIISPSSSAVTLLGMVPCCATNSRMRIAK